MLRHAAASAARTLSALRTACAARGLSASAASASPPAAASETIGGLPVSVHNPSGDKRVVVTKELPGERWLSILTGAGCRVEVCTSDKPILDVSDIRALMGVQCDGVIGQLTEDWSEEAFGALAQAGGKAFSNYAVGYNNVKVPAATAVGIPVGNTPGVLTDTTAELAAALALAAARRVPEADVFMRAGKYKGWLPTLFVGSLLQRKTVGIIGAGRIGLSFAKMMVEGHKMDLIYYDLFEQPGLEEYFSKYGDFLESAGEERVRVTRAGSVEEVLATADLVSLHCVMDESTRGLINKERLGMMKPDATLVNAARGEVIVEADLVAHLRANPEFRAGLDVFEREPLMAEGLAECPNAVIVPHIASASQFTRGGMATIAAANVAMRLADKPVWGSPDDVRPFLDGAVEGIPQASPSIVNADELGLATL